MPASPFSRPRFSGLVWLFLLAGTATFLLQGALLFAQDQPASEKESQPAYELPLYIQFQEPSKKPDGEKDMPFRRWQWFYEQRAYPLGRIPTGLRLKALQQLDRMIEVERLRQQALVPRSPEGTTAATTFRSSAPIRARVLEKTATGKSKLTPS